MIILITIYNQTFRIFRYFKQFSHSNSHFGCPFCRATALARLNSARSIYSARVQRPRAKSPTAGAPRVASKAREKHPITRLLSEDQLLTGAERREWMGMEVAGITINRYYYGSFPHSLPSTSKIVSKKSLEIQRNPSSSTHLHPH